MVPGHPANSGLAVDVNPVTAIARQAALQGQHPVVRYAGGDLTYAELDRRSAQLASVLVDGGVAAGDRVAYLGLNSPAFVLTMLACWRIGALFVPVNFRLAEPELRSVLERSGAITIVAEEGHRAVVEAVRDTTALHRFLLVDDDPEVPAPSQVPAGWEAWSGLLGAAPALSGVLPRTADDPAILMFTSGTTGTPKGVVITYGNAWWNSVNVDLRMDTRRGDVTHAAAPLFHIGALNSFAIRTLSRGGTLVLRRAFEPLGLLRDIADFGVNSMFAVPAMLSALTRTPGAFDTDLSSLRAVVVAGAPVPPSLIEQFVRHEVFLEQAWGLTETAPFATHLGREWTLSKLGSAGVAMPYTEVRVVDAATGDTLPAGAAGEVVVRGPNVTPGYWENAEATAAAFDDEGWFHSGDVGYLDEDGCLFIVDRLKDMIISGGENVYPAEVERVLADLPGITDVAVVGRADPEWGETVVAVVSLARGGRVSLEDVRVHAGARLARYKLPRQLHVTDQVPRNASGKLEKSKVRDIVEHGTSRETTAP